MTVVASMADIAKYAYTAGLRNPGKLAMAVAIAEAESSGNPNAHNTKKGADARGMWQINVAAGAHPEYASQNLYDPVTNAKAMVTISKSGTSWGPWQSYPLRAAAFLPPATAAVTVFLANPSVASDYAGAAVGAVAQATGVDALAQGVTAAVQTPLKVLSFLTEPGTWVRVALFGLGASMVIGGLMLFARPAIDSAGKSVMEILPTGKIASTVMKGVAA